MHTFTKSFLITLISCVVTGTLYGQVTFQWNHYYDGGMNDKSLTIGRDASDDTHIAGTTETPGGVKLVTRKYESDGDLQWTKISNTFLTGNVLFIKRDNSFNTYVVCVNLSISGFTIFKFGTNAHEVWKRNFTERPVGLEIDPNGKVVYVGGQSTGGFFARCYRASDGHINWARTESDGREAASMDIDKSGHVIVGGVNGAAPGYLYNDDIRIVKFGISSYSFIWATNYNGADDQRDNVHLLKVDNSGNVYIAGEINAYGSMGANISMAKFNSSGVFQWEQYLTNAGGPVSAFAQTLLIDPSQNPVLTGQKNDFYNISPINETSRIFVTKLDRHTGVPVFFVYPDDPTLTDQGISEAPVSATIDQYGNIYVGGYGNQTAAFFTDREWLVTKIDEDDGYNKWIQVGNMPGIDNQVSDLYISNSGSVYMAVTQTFYFDDIDIEKYKQAGGGLKLASQPSLNPEDLPVTFNLYPNPSATIFTLNRTYTDKPIAINIFDISGRLVNSYNNIPEKFEFGEELKPGTYFVNILNGEERKTVKIIKVAE